MEVEHKDKIMKIEERFLYKIEFYTEENIYRSEGIIYRIHENRKMKEN